MAEIKDYDKNIEDLFINFMVSNPELFVRCKGILKSEYFDNKQNQSAIRFIDEYTNEYASFPAVTQIKAVTGKEIELMPVEAYSQDRWFFDEIEVFCRYKGLRDAILTSPKLLEEGRYGEVEANVKSAVQIGLVKDLGTDYFSDPKARLEAIKNSNGQIKTGWKDIDDKLYGGLNRGEITIFAAVSGGGKSLFLQNLAVNWAFTGMNVVYITLELSEKLCSLRLDAMTTGFETRDVMKNIDAVDLKLRSLHKKHKGELRLKQLPNGCTSNDIRAYIKEYEVQTNSKVDAVLVDYIDLLMPISKKISAENLFIKDKYVTEELRNLAVELNVLMASASQLNRCIAPESVVTIENKGDIRIKDIEIGDKILSSVGYNTILNKSVQKQHTYKIKMKSGKEIICSAHHKFPTSSGEITIESGLVAGNTLFVKNDK